MWFEPSTMRIPPEISHRNPRFGAELPAYHNFVGRRSMVLQGGRCVADIGVLYPVVALQAAYRFDVPGIKQPNWGKDAPPEADYLRISKVSVPAHSPFPDRSSARGHHHRHRPVRLRAKNSSRP